jgi:putative Mg2+ transporter-C (MgtC) family protein
VAVPGFEGLFETGTIMSALGTLLKLGLAALLGGIVGIEREITRRPAGIRTHMLVCFGCALFAELSGAFGSPTPDRVAAQIVTGVGFLGAGTILRTGLEVKGLTTAASIWAVAAIGMAVSVGGSFFWVAVLATALTLGTLRIVATLEDKVIDSGKYRRMNVAVESRDTVPALMESLTEAGAEIGRVTVSRQEQGFGVSLSLASGEPNMLRLVAEVPGVVTAEWADSH